MAIPGGDAGTLIESLTQVHRPKLLTRPAFAGFLLGAAGRRITAGPTYAAHKVLDAIVAIAAGTGAPADVRARMISEAIRALAFDARNRPRAPAWSAGAAADTLAAAGVLRALAVTGGAVPPETLEAVGRRGREAAAAGAAAARVDGAETVLRALALWRGGVDRFEDLADVAVQRLFEQRERFAAFLANVKCSPEAAAWVVSLHDAGQSAGTSTDAVIGMLDHLADPAVREYLLRKRSLSALLRARERDVEIVLTTLRPPPASLAAALMDVVTSGSIPVGVALAVEYLASGFDRTNEALGVWGSSGADSTVLVELYLHGSWGEKAGDTRAGAALDLLSNPLPHPLVTRILDAVAKSKMVLHQQQMNLVGQALRILAKADCVGDVSADTWRALLSRADSLADFDATLMEVADESSDRTRTALRSVSVLLTARVVETGDVPLLRQRLSATPPARLQLYWSEVIRASPQGALATPRVLAAFADGVGDADEGGFARELFLAALAAGSREPTQAAREALIRIGWAARGTLKFSLGGWIKTNMGHALPVLFQLMAHPAPIDLLIELEEAVLPWAGETGAQWSHCERFEERLALWSPSTVEAFRERPRTRRRKTLLLLPARSPRSGETFSTRCSRNPNHPHGNNEQRLDVRRERRRRRRQAVRSADHRRPVRHRIRLATDSATARAVNRSWSTMPNRPGRWSRSSSSTAGVARES